MILALTTKDGEAELILTTTEHPFYVIGVGFVPAGFLLEGLYVATADGQTLRVSKVDTTPFELWA